MAGDIIGQPTTVTGLSVTSTPGSSGTAPPLIAVLAVAGGSQVTLASNTSMILGSNTTLTLSGALCSWRTFAGDSSLVSLGPTNPDNGQFGFILRASGMSLVYRSGNTIYNFNSAGSGAAV